MNTKSIFLIFITASIIAITFINCNENGITENEFQIQHQRELQLTNTYINEISPLNNEFIATTIALKNKLIVLQQEVTLQNLEAAQTAWKKALKIWKHLELYNIGGIDESFIHFQINAWPTNEDNIDSYINGSVIIDENFIASVGSSSKGVSGLEYLLFSSKNNSKVLSSFTSETNAERRLAYTIALAEDLHTKATMLSELWVAYKPEFISSLENGISGSQSQITNAMITLIEEIIMTKLGNALGDDSGGNSTVSDLEAYRSNTSLLIIEEHLKALNRCFNGNFKTNVIPWGYDDYLSLIQREILKENIKNALTECFDKINVIQGSLSDALINDKQKVTDLQEVFKKLLVLIKIDLTNAIGTTVTINDNDGD